MRGAEEHYWNLERSAALVRAMFDEVSDDEEEIGENELRLEDIIE